MWIQIASFSQESGAENWVRDHTGQPGLTTDGNESFNAGGGNYRGLARKYDVIVFVGESLSPGDDYMRLGVLAQAVADLVRPS